MSNEKTNAIELANDAIEKAIASCKPEILETQPVFVRTLALARGIRDIRLALTDDVMKVVMSLRGSPLGFLTDRDSKPEKYSVEEVRECIAEGMLRGLMPIGNEINIISGRMYAAKAGLRRLITEIPGLTDLNVEVGSQTPATNGTVLVECYAAWLINGQRGSLDCCEQTVEGIKRDTRIAVKVNNGMGPDAVAGKAERKLYARILAKLSTSTLGVIPSGDALDAEGVVVEETKPVSKTSAALRDVPSVSIPKPMREPGEEG